MPLLGHALNSFGWPVDFSKSTGWLFQINCWLFQINCWGGKELFQAACRVWAFPNLFADAVDGLLVPMFSKEFIHCISKALVPTSIPVVLLVWSADWVNFQATLSTLQADLLVVIEDCQSFFLPGKIAFAILPSPGPNSLNPFQVLPERHQGFHLFWDLCFPGCMRYQV